MKRKKTRLQVRKQQVRVLTPRDTARVDGGGTKACAEAPIQVVDTIPTADTAGIPSRVETACIDTTF